MKENIRPAVAHAQAGALASLLVEDEAPVAIETAHHLTEASFDIVGLARSVAAALELLSRSGCDAAVRDIDLGRERSEAVPAGAPLRVRYCTCAHETAAAGSSHHGNEEVYRPARRRICR